MLSESQFCIKRVVWAGALFCWKIYSLTKAIVLPVNSIQVHHVRDRFWAVTEFSIFGLRWGAQHNPPGTFSTLRSFVQHHKVDFEYLKNCTMVILWWSPSSIIFHASFCEFEITPILRHPNDNKHLPLMLNLVTNSSWKLFRFCRNTL